MSECKESVCKSTPSKSDTLNDVFTLSLASATAVPVVTPSRAPSTLPFTSGSCEKNEEELELCAICLSPLKKFNNTCIENKRDIISNTSAIAQTETMKTLGAKLLGPSTKNICNTPKDSKISTLESTCSSNPVYCTPRPYSENNIEETRCKHFFHKSCLVNIRNNKCPICRRQLVESTETTQDSNNSISNNNDIIIDDFSGSNIVANQYQAMITNFFPNNAGHASYAGPISIDDPLRLAVKEAANRKRNAVRMALSRQANQLGTAS